MEMQQQTTLLKTAIALLFQHFFVKSKKNQHFKLVCQTAKSPTNQLCCR